MDITNLILQLKSKVTNNILDQQMISKAIALLKVGAVDQVGSTAQLPAAASNAGKLFYVLNDGLYFSDSAYWIAISQGSAVRAYAWGNGACAAFGDVTTNYVSRCSPVIAASSFADWKCISVGNDSTQGNRVFGIRRDNSLWSWGSNACGVTGRNTTFGNTTTPSLVCGFFKDWCTVSAGCRFTLAVRTNGTLWSWGYNNNGQLGDNTTTARSSPVTVSGGFTDWCQVAAGCNHALGIRRNGTLWSWGNNLCGKLGDITTVYKSSPISVVGGFTDWCQVSAARCQSLAVRSNGQGFAWGGNVYGLLGTNNTISTSSPVSVVGGLSWRSIATMDNASSIGITTNCILYSWGRNNFGQLGDNTVTNRSSPVTVVGGFTDWCTVSTGSDFTAAIRTNGTMWSWGRNFNGMLGDGTAICRSSPVTVIGGFTDWFQVSTTGVGATYSTTIALRKAL